MSLERVTMAFAGAMILLSITLTLWVHPNFVWFTAFVGINLLQSAFTGFCPASKIMHWIGIKSERKLVLKG
ncbi:MAG: YgaP family membrane protein [bacterium]